MSDELHLLGTPSLNYQGTFKISGSSLQADLETFNRIKLRVTSWCGVGGRGGCRTRSVNDISSEGFRGHIRRSKATLKPQSQRINKRWRSDRKEVSTKISFPTFNTTVWQSNQGGSRRDGLR